MPDESGRIRPISVPACPWHEPDSDEQHELDQDDSANLPAFMHAITSIRRKDKR